MAAEAVNGKITIEYDRPLDKYRISRSGNSLQLSPIIFGGKDLEIPLHGISRSDSQSLSEVSHLVISTQNGKCVFQDGFTSQFIRPNINPIPFEIPTQILPETIDGSSYVHSQSLRQLLGNSPQIVDSITNSPEIAIRLDTSTSRTVIYYDEELDPLAQEIYSLSGQSIRILPLSQSVDELAYKESLNAPYLYILIEDGEHTSILKIIAEGVRNYASKKSAE